MQITKKFVLQCTLFCPRMSLHFILFLNNIFKSTLKFTEIPGFNCATREHIKGLQYVSLFRDKGEQGSPET